MKEIFRSKIFYGISIAFAVMFFLLGINYNRNYIGEVEILVLPKSETTSGNLEQIMANIEELPTSLNFYESLLLSNEDVEDEIEEVSSYEKKDAWTSMFSVSQVKNSSIVKIKTRSQNQLQAEVLAKGIARQIAVSMSRYYNIQTELEIRILDEPVVSEENRGGDLKIITSSILFGMIFGWLFSFGIQKQRDNFAPTLKSVMRGAGRINTERNVEKKELAEMENVSAAEENFLQQTFANEDNAPVQEKVSEIKAVPEKKIVSEKIAVPEKKIETAGVKKSSAPDNLPVGEDFILNNLKLVAEKKAFAEKELIFASKKDDAPKSHEATEEEIKRRLNKLLGGK
jgi:capsular polysaccharide biosynthesis protein